MDLTTLATVKAWLGISSSADDANVSALITQISGRILAHLQRPYVFKRSYTETLSGTGGVSQFLKNYPVISVSSVTIDGIVIPAGNYNTAGFMLELADDGGPGRPQQVMLNGYCFNDGMSNVVITYTAGYSVENEAHTSPSAPFQVPVNAPYGVFAVDGGVTVAGVALTPVASGPIAGQYSVSSTGVYTFASAGLNALISYSYSPSALQEACTEIVAERYRYKDRIGTTSKNLNGQETVAFDNSGTTKFVLDGLAPFRRRMML